MNQLIALVGFITSFALFLDNIDSMLDKDKNIYKKVRTTCICINVFVMLHFYFVL